MMRVTKFILPAVAVAMFNDKSEVFKAVTANEKEKDIYTKKYI
jgi:hypothetical protein